MNNPCHQVPLTQLTAASGSCFTDVFSMLRHHGFNEIAQAPTRLPRAWVSPGVADTQPTCSPPAAPCSLQKRPLQPPRVTTNSEQEMLRQEVCPGGGGTAWRPRGGCGLGRTLSAWGWGRGWVPELGDMCRGEICHLGGPAAPCPQDWTSGGQLCPSQLRSKLVPMRPFPESLGGPQSHPRF